MILADRATNAAVEAVTRLLDGGALRVYDGPPPPSADGPATGVLLVEVALPSPAFDDPVEGLAVARPIEVATAVASGTAHWFRAVQADGVTVLDGRVGEIGSDADLEFDTRFLAEGDRVEILELRYRQPAQ